MNKKKIGKVIGEFKRGTLHSGKNGPVVTNPTQLLNLYNNGLYNPASLIEMIDRKAFGVVVLRAQFYPPPVLQALGQKYRTLADVDMNGFTYHVLVPR